MASSQRVARLREEVKRETSDILYKMKDPRLGFITVTDAEVSRDMGYVRIFVSIMGDAEAVERTMEALQAGTGYVRTELGRRIRLRHTPEIVFRLDRSVEQGARIEEIITELHKNEGNRESGYDG